MFFLTYSPWYFLKETFVMDSDTNEENYLLIEILRKVLKTVIKRGKIKTKSCCPQK